MRRALLIVVAGAAIAYLGLCTILFAFQRSLIYIPQPRWAQSDAPVLELRSGSERLVVSSRPGRGDQALVYFGGNSEDVSYSLPTLAEAFPDAAIYALHYRAYGGSSGSPSEAALFADALALFDMAHAAHSKVSVLGGSLGSGVAIYLASQRPVERLMLVTPYDSFQDLIAQKLPWLPIRWLLRDKFESWRYAPQVSAPTLILMAENDEMIPRDSTELLHSRFRKETARLALIRGATHNTIYDDPDYVRLLMSW